uniref:Uncharacterized protein n=1 Tax=Pyxicephalus adspersus TaxID=30357 RepID=A0AAV3ARM8_PYXAD|nr:TPA: hypothetical protein GDO54_011287 [Pyxicephalus adspersus]
MLSTLGLLTTCGWVLLKGKVSDLAIPLPPTSLVPSPFLPRLLPALISEACCFLNSGNVKRLRSLFPKTVKGLLDPTGGRKVPEFLARELSRSLSGGVGDNNVDGKLLRFW